VVRASVAPLTARSRFSLLRDPLDCLKGIGFTIEHLDRFRLGIIEEVVARNDLAALISAVSCWTVRRAAQPEGRKPLTKPINPPMAPK
jgi:hypothetical protein